jgi:Isochorismatase family
MAHSVLLHLLTTGFGTSRNSGDVRLESAKWAKADLIRSLSPIVICEYTPQSVPLRRRDTARVPGPGETVTQEHWCSSGFANTDVDLQLKKHGIHQLIVMGLIAHTCIEATVRHAAELGYEVTVVRDETADYSDEMMHVALDINMPNYASATVPTKEVLASISSLGAPRPDAAKRDGLNFQQKPPADPFAMSAPAQKAVSTAREVAQLVAAYLTEIEQRINESSVQHEILQLGEGLVRTGIRRKDGSNDGLCLLNDIGIGCHAHLADQSVDAHYRGGFCLITYEGVHIQFRCLLDELRIEFLPSNLVL